MSSSFDTDVISGEQLLPRILDSRPVVVDKTGPFEVHILTCERDKVMVLWALKTFYHYFGSHPPLVIHDDGSMTADTVALLHKHFVNCRVVTNAEAVRDAKFRAQFERHPLCSLWRFQSRPPLAIRVFDFPYFAKAPYILEFDSDLLFFNEPTEIKEYCKLATPFLSSDYKSSYICAPSALKSLAGFEILPNLNTGLGGFPASMLDYDFVEELFNNAMKSLWGGRFVCYHAWIEQTVTALLFMKAGGRSVLDIARYRLSSMLLDDNAVTHHFPNDGSRSYFGEWGVRRLIERGVPALG